MRALILLAAIFCFGIWFGQNHPEQVRQAKQFVKVQVNHILQ